MPTIPHSDAGWRIEPPVSVPIAQGARPAATAAAEPPLEPPGTRSVSHGLPPGPGPAPPPRARAAARAARHTVRVPRVADGPVARVLVRGAHRELVHVRL